MKESSIKKYLTLAGVQDEFHQSAINCINLAKERSKGLVWIKWKTRLFHTKMVSEIIPWEAERLIDIRPESACSMVCSTFIIRNQKSRESK